MSHRSVLLKEAVDWLAPEEGRVVLDGTVGGGGHAELILEHLGTRGRLIGVDKDASAVAGARERLARFGDRVMILQEDFKNIPQILEKTQNPHVDGVLLDLGVSSMQLDESERGFSFREAGPLDMRMDTRGSLTAEEIVNTYRKEDLLTILWDLGEERFARRIVEKIIWHRSKHPIRNTAELAAIIQGAMPPSHRYGRTHPATRSFQALRIAVNHELESLREFLGLGLDFLSAGGRVVVISFHSLEDREVKRAFRRFAAEKMGRVLTKRPVRPAEDEVRTNPRSRSAKLRAFEKF